MGGGEKHASHTELASSLGQCLRCCRVSELGCLFPLHSAEEQKHHSKPCAPFFLRPEAGMKPGTGELSQPGVVAPSSLRSLRAVSAGLSLSFGCEGLQLSPLF